MLPAALITDPMNPNRPANWRWERARWLREKARYARSGGVDDEYVQMARKFQADQAKAGTETATIKLSRSYPGIFWAHDLFGRSNNDVRWQIEAYLLADLNYETIAGIVGTDPAIVLWYEKLFFNVRGRLSHEGWIVAVVLGASVHHGVTERDYDLLWKMVGYGLGPIYLQEFIKPVGGTRVRDLAAIGTATDEWISRQSKKKAAIGFQTMPVYNNQAIIFEAWNRSREIEKSQASGSQIGIVQNLQVAVSSMPYTTGRPDNGTPPALAAYDSSPVELRAGEQLRLTAGRDDIADMSAWQFPASPVPDHGRGRVE